MSADNATFVVFFPDKTIRVAQGSMSVMDELETWLYKPEDYRQAVANMFGLSPIFTDEDRAWAHAELLESEGWTEYGQCEFHLSANFGELRAEIAEPAPYDEGCCPHCSYPHGTQVSHGFDYYSEYCKNPELPFNRIKNALGKYDGINASLLARVVFKEIRELL